MKKTEVKAEARIIFCITTPEPAKNSDLRKLFEKLISDSNGIERQWKLSYETRFASRPENKDIVWGDWGFKVSNVSKAEEQHFYDVLRNFCKEVGLQIEGG